MKLYAEHRPRAAMQVLFDLVMIAAVVGCVWVGSQIHQAAQNSRGGADELSRNAKNLSKNLSDAGTKLEKTPVVGDTLKAPFDKASGAATKISDGGTQLSEGIGQLGQLLGVMAGLPIALIVLLVWALVRLRYAHHATAAAKLRKLAGDDLLALRALDRLPAKTIARISPTAVADWKADDPHVVHALADGYLGSLGLRGSNRVLMPSAPAPVDQGPLTPTDGTPTHTAPLPRIPGQDQEGGAER